MASIAKPSKASIAIASLTSGLGASRLSPSVTALTVRTRRRAAGAGERAFIKDVLPRLAYANPKVPIQVTFLRPPEHQVEEGKDEAASTSESDKAKAEYGSLTIEFGNNVPPRKIQLSSAHSNKPASLIAREILDLARFQDEALDEQARAASQAATTNSASKTRGDAPVAPEPSSTNLAGSAEGVSQSPTSTPV